MNSRYGLGCGHQSGDNDSSYALSNHQNIDQKWFKKIDTTVQVGRASEALQKVLESDPDIST